MPLLDDAEIGEAGGWRLNYEKTEQRMTTTLSEVHEDELVDVVAFLMERKHIRHFLLEGDAHSLAGLVSCRSVLRLLAQDFDSSTDEAPPVKGTMDRDSTSVTPETPTLDAIDLRRRHKVSCLPVVNDGELVGIVSETDFMPFAYQLLQERLGGDGTGD